MDLPKPFYEHDGQIAIELPGARAVFTTQSWGDVRDTWTEIAARLGVDVAYATQVHGARVLTITESIGQHLAPLAEADALVTTAPGVAAMVVTADCVPIVITGPGTVASVHAGWRGLDAGVITKTIGALRETTGAGELSAAIGPAAGPCCYEVGSELHDRFTGFSRGRNLDLKAIARAQLEQADVGAIHDAGVCTICSNPDLLFSYRRDGARTGRQAAIAWLT